MGGPGVLLSRPALQGKLYLDLYMDVVKCRMSFFVLDLFEDIVGHDTVLIT